MEKLKQFIYDFGTCGASLTFRMLLEKETLTDNDKRVAGDICNRLSEALTAFAEEQGGTNG